MLKKQLHMLVIIVVAVLISFVCDQPKSLVEASESGPNTFDSDGNLCLSGGTTLQEIGTPMELWAGVGNNDAGTLAGYITFDDQNVKINLTDLDNDGTPDIYPWVATEVHIHFASTVDGIPQNKNENPIPGHFEYNIEDLELFDYIIEVEDPYRSEIVIPVDFEAVGAIHLAVEKDYSAVDLFADYLPEDAVQMKITHPLTDSYVELTLTEAGLLDGVYEGWCVDVDQTIDNNTLYTAHLYSSYEDLTGLDFEQPENFDKVNYLLNNFSADDMVTPLSSECNPIASCGGTRPPEALTKGDIQRAIWILIDDDLTTSGLGPWSQERVNAILCDVNANGEGFIPDCDEETVFIAVPDDGNVQLIAAQTIISSIGIECVTASESAWGDAKYGEEIGRQWATYFNYDEMCVPE